MEETIKLKKRKMMLVSVHTTGLISFNTMMTTFIREHWPEAKLSLSLDPKLHRVVFTFAPDSDIEMKVTNKVLCCCSKDVTTFILATDSKIRIKQSKKFELQPVGGEQNNSFWIDCRDPII